MTGQEFLVSLVSFTPFYDGTMVEFSLVDWLATTEKSPKDYLPDYPHERFRGKGLGNLLINLIQVLTYEMSGELSSKVLLHAADHLHSFYENLGFVSLSKDEKELNGREDLIEHLKKIKLDSSLSAFILKDELTILHSRRAFVNHVLQSLDRINFNSSFESDIAKRLHGLFGEDTEILKAIVI